MVKRALLSCVACVALLLVWATPAFAYRESSTGTTPSLTPAWSCPDCHGLEGKVTSPTVGQRSVPSTWTWDTEAGTNVGSRKGPHGGYTAGTQKCETCHSMHGATGINGPLLAEPTISATCFTCHDGTGGGGVYGVIKQRTGFDPASASATGVAGTAGGVHRIRGYNATVSIRTIPGGASDGSSLVTTFTGLAGSLTCTDCHSPHNALTVKPFKGDRLRSLNDTTSAYKTNRLLKARPTGGSVSYANYGSDWCQSCHKGVKGRPNLQHHSVADSSTTGSSYYYDRVSKFTTYGVSALTTYGPLGGDNLGYVWSFDQPEPGDPPTAPLVAVSQGTFANQRYPICQQCHEDARNVGDQAALSLTNWYVDGTSERFTSSLDGSGTLTASQEPTTGRNPPFQNFPHETVRDGMLIENNDDLCLNCHHY